MDSTNVGTKNLLLKITVPNCKGRQRKRRSDAPGNEASEKVGRVSDKGQHDQQVADLPISHRVKSSVVSSKIHIRPRLKSLVV